ncbi:hypothetical protein QTN25_001841 [Entamoeba marina]
MKFVNKNFDFIFNDTFIKDLTNVAHEYALDTQKQFRNDMKNGFAISKTTGDAIETTINRRLINHNKRTLLKDYNIFKDRGLKMEIKNRITGNLVWCQVDPCVIARKAIKQGAMTLPTANRTYSSGRAMTVLEHEYASIYPAQFTQIRDSSEVYWCVNDGTEDIWVKSGVTLTCSDVQMTELFASRTAAAPAASANAAASAFAVAIAVVI